MISDKQYRKHTSDEWEGTKVKARRPIESGRYSLPAGTIFTVERKYSGFKLRSDPCDECGGQMKVRKVPPRALELVEPGWKDDG